MTTHRPFGDDSVAQNPHSRRGFLQMSLVAATAMWTGRAHPVAAMGSSEGAETPAPAQRLWILDSVDEVKPDAPAAPTRADLDELLAMQAARDADVSGLIAQWNSRPAILPWADVANAAYVEFTLTPIRQYRANALLLTAIADAVAASDAAQTAFATPLPATLDARITPAAGTTPGAYAYPSAEAAVSGAAATVLTALLPDAAPGRFTDLAQMVAETRLQAGLNTRPDIAAGLALGQAIGERAVALAANDAPQSAWDGSGRLEGEGYWVPTPPAFADPQEPLAATWRRWVLERADQFRLAPPPAFGSPAWASQVAAVQAAVANRSLIQAEKALYWQNTAASTLWDHYAADLIARYSLDLTDAAEIMAAQAVAVADAVIATWDGKYHYWVERPITADPDLQTLFPSPPFPSYPAAHATVSNAAAVVLASYFPQEAGDLLALASEAAASRVWAGIHYPMDVDSGGAMGREVGYLVVNAVRGSSPS